jgi:hypothetical protein
LISPFTYPGRAAQQTLLVPALTIGFWLIAALFIGAVLAAILSMY